MTTPTRSHRTAAALGLAVLVSLPSCSLPPGEAWRQMRQDGLVAFVSNGLSAPKAIAPTASAPGMVAASSATAPSKVVLPPAPSVQPVAAASSGFQVAYSVKNLTGYVRTPYTNPPRLVDVRGQSAGSKMVCPYTQKPFIVPAEAVGAPARSMMASSKPKSAPAPQPKPQAPVAPVKSLDEAPKLIATAPPVSPPKPQAPATTKPTPAPAVASAPAPKTTPPPVAKTTPKTEPKKEPAPTVAANTAPTKPAADPTPKLEPKTEPAPAPQAAAPKLPFGAPIPGRPGFVNSPFAEKHQLVDVTGLSVGTEVKCPYTGKLFRVPPQAQAKR